MNSFEVMKIFFRSLTRPHSTAAATALPTASYDPYMAVVSKWRYPAAIVSKRTVVSWWAGGIGCAAVPKPRRGILWPEFKITSGTVHSVFSMKFPVRKCEFVELINWYNRFRKIVWRMNTFLRTDISSKKCSLLKEFLKTRECDLCLEKFSLQCT